MLITESPGHTLLKQVAPGNLGYRERREGRKLRLWSLNSFLSQVSPLSTWKVLIEKLQVQGGINCNDLRVKSLKRSMVWRKGNNDIYSGGGLIAQLCLTLLQPCSLLGSSVCGIFQARVLEWVAISSSRESFSLRDRNCISCISCIADKLFFFFFFFQTNSLPLSHQGSHWDLLKVIPLQSSG